MDFTQYFKEIPLERLVDDFNIFDLVGKDFYAVGAGNVDEFNAMIGSGGGFGLFFKKPCSWCLFRSDRYTLELIQKQQSYTISYFPQEYRSQMLSLGEKSGRNTNKMKESGLTIIETSLGNRAFAEAKLIIECKLTAITCPSPDDFYSKESRDYIDEAYTDENQYRKLVFGEISKVWIKK